MTPRLSPRAYLWPALVLAALVWTWIVRPWPTALIATGFALAAFLAALIAHGAESERLRAWYDDELGRCDDELDEYDRLRRVVAPVARPPVSPQATRAALKALREVWPAFDPDAEDETDYLLERAS